ncbi:MAG: hypothetical protein IJU89_00390 [Alphaproteobacteria bacterium]|nr:hypothetical protein [Alphaproteobacteria bacterium]
MTVCVLSGLEIPPGKSSREHYLPRAVCPPYIYNLPQNIFPAIKVFNWAKAAYYPCQWYDLRYELCHHAYKNWNIKAPDRKLLLAALTHGFPEYDPCELCVARQFTEYCINQRGQR